jgi:hypothetical protein
MRRQSPVAGICDGRQGMLLWCWLLGGCRLLGVAAGATSRVATRGIETLQPVAGEWATRV